MADRYHVNFSIHFKVNILHSARKEIGKKKQYMVLVDRHRFLYSSHKSYFGRASTFWIKELGGGYELD